MKTPMINYIIFVVTISAFVDLSTAFSLRSRALFSSSDLQNPLNRPNTGGFYRSKLKLHRPMSYTQINTDLQMNFFKRLLGKSKTNSEESEERENASETEIDSSLALETPDQVTDSNGPVSSNDPESILKTAQLLRDQAERARKEARNLDLLLTKEKITKLEKQLAVKTIMKDEKQLEFIQNQIKILQLKLDAPSDHNTITGMVTSSIVSETKTVSDNLERISNNAAISSDDIQFMVNSFNKAPPFMQSAVLKVGGYTNNQTVNLTAFAEKMIQDDQQFQRQNSGKPTGHKHADDGLETSIRSDPDIDSDFEQKEIDEIVDVLRLVPQFLKNIYPENIRNNDTAIALLMLKDEWKQKGNRQHYTPTQEEILRKMDEVKWIPTFVKGDNETAFALELIEAEQRQYVNSDDGEYDDEIDEINEEEGAMNQTMISSFPKRLRKEGLGPSENNIKIITEDLVKQNIWVASTRPEKVPGGFIVRGSTKFDNGDDLIDAIYKRLVSQSLDSSVNIFYIADPTPITKEEQLDDDRNPVLYITGHDVAVESSPPLLSLITAVGFGTLWYSAIYPCILNENVQKMVEEQLALTDSSISPNLEVLNHMAVPIFVASFGIQASHELAHRFVAASNGLNITFPTLVPSLVTGFTTAIISIKTPAKNKQAVFDFAICGPLTGMIVSISSLLVGLSIMQSMDVSLFSTLPALPIQVLRQSSLGGGIIDSVLPGLLRIPSGSESSSAISSININLHPLVIAGFLGLQLNALALLPLGKTDGGRVSTQLFGRRGAQLVNAITLLAIFVQGILGSDILLYYFSYAIFFENELDLPAKNEVDDISFPRVLIATASIMLVLLTLIPM